MAVAAGDGSVSDTTMTRMQELGSAWIFKRAIQDNKGWQRWEHFKKDAATFDEIKKIWKKVGKVNWVDDVDDKWLENFYKQQKVLLRKIGRPDFTEFSRDGGPKPAYILPGSKGGETFMDWVSKLVKDEFEIGQKDNWNPADIWLIQNEAKWKREIIKIWKKRKNPKGSLESELARFNTLFVALFRSKQIMGISLKKVGKTATFKEVNVSGKFFRKIKTTKMILESATCKLGTVKISDKAAEDAIRRGKLNPRTGLVGRGKAGAATLIQDSKLVIKDPGIGPSGKPTIYKVQIKANDSTKFSNLKWEPTIEDKSGARLGKATVELVLDLMRVYKMMPTYEPDNKVFPRDQTGFRKVIPMYKKILDELVNDNWVDLGPGVDTTTAIINIAETYDIYRSQPWVAQSKLQQIRFIYALASIGEKKRNDFCTSLIFTAEKAGKRYGPYGKIY